MCDRSVLGITRLPHARGARITTRCALCTRIPSAHAVDRAENHGGAGADERAATTALSARSDAAGGPVHARPLSGGIAIAAPRGEPPGPGGAARGCSPGLATR